MFKPLALSLAGAVALAVAPAGAAENEAAEPTMSKGEKKLAKLLDGRVAGEPQNCINTLRRSANLQIIDKTAIVVRDGKTIWVNWTAHPRHLDDDDVLVIRKFGSASRLCRTDHITTIDRFGGFFSGSVFLDQFVPYRKADSAPRS